MVTKKKLMIMTKVNRISIMCVAVLAATSFLSCSKEENVATGKTAIGFHCTDVQTKALVSEVEDMHEAGFGVYAHATFESTGATYSFNRKVTYDTSAGWNYVTPEYWLPGGSYTFRAYYPAEFPATINEVSPKEYSIQGFKIAPQYGTQQDILMASASRSTAETVTLGTTVPFTFSHLLSNLNVTLKVEQIVREVEVEKKDENGEPVLGADGNPVMETITETINALDAVIKAVAFSGVSQSADYNGSWINHAGSAAIGDNMKTVVEVTPEGVSVFGDDGLLAIPKTLADGDVALYILADITLPTGTTMQKDWTLRIPAITWAPNTKYNYTATLTADFNIEFDEPKVESWGQEQMSGTVIIR